MPVVQRSLPAAVLPRRGNLAGIRATVAEPVSTGGGSDDLENSMLSYVKERGGSRLIRRILIANNGMAATKTIMSIRNWAYNTFGDERAIQFVVMATPEDLAANAEFIRRADDFVEVPGGSNVNNYANVQLIVDLCIKENVDAVMVGWGHASENPKLGDLLKLRSAELGREITFIGPSSDVMRILGDKIGSTLVAQDAGVSCMPWNGDGMRADLDENRKIPQANFDAACITSEDMAVEAAKKVGYPVMLKASEGGGGKGIRMADDETTLRAAWPQVVNEVPGSPIFLVTLCKGARHIAIHLGMPTSPV
jgi:acetyl-CoA carboxylase/biotin carboxylase 1